MPIRAASNRRAITSRVPWPVGTEAPRRPPASSFRSGDGPPGTRARRHSVAVMHQGLRDPGSRQGSGQTLPVASSDSRPGFRRSGTAGGCSAREVLRVFARGTQKYRPWQAPGFRSCFVENVEVNAKKKKRSRCSLCGEQWWGIGVHLTAHWLRPRTGGPEEVWQMYEDQRPGRFRLAGEVRGVPREHDAR